MKKKKTTISKNKEEVSTMSFNLTADRYHDISCGHRVVGHEGKCQYLHGHNYRIHFSVAPKDGLDNVGRVLDFSVIKHVLCEWLERNWDHKTLLWKEDPLSKVSVIRFEDGESVRIGESFVIVPFNPTAENMAQYLLEVVGEKLFANSNVYLKKIVIEETRKCSVTMEIE